MPVVVLQRVSPPPPPPPTPLRRPPPGEDARAFCPTPGVVITSGQAPLRRPASGNQTPAETFGPPQGPHNTFSIPILVTARPRGLPDDCRDRAAGYRFLSCLRTLMLAAPPTPCSSVHRPWWCPWRSPCGLPPRWSTCRRCW